MNLKKKKENMSLLFKRKKKRKIKLKLKLIKERKNKIKCTWTKSSFWLESCDTGLEASSNNFWKVDGSKDCSVFLWFSELSTPKIQ